MFLTRDNLKEIISNESATVKLKKEEQNNDIAVIGFAGKFPGAPNSDKFWENLVKGVESVTEIPKNRWDNSLYYDEHPATPLKNYCPRGGFLDDIDKFDNTFFNI